MSSFKAPLFFMLFCSISAATYAQAPGQLDLEFGIAGQVYETFPAWGRAEAMQILPDDRILIAGVNESVDGIRALVARFMPNGDLDLSFGVDGSVQQDLGGTITTLSSLVVNEDGSFFAAGKTHFDGRDHMVVAKFHADGDLDEAFGDGGVLVISYDANSHQSARDIAVDASGRILLAGMCYIGSSFYGAIVRLDAQGNLDDTFGETGFVIPPQTAEGSFATAKFESISMQADGKILVAGSFGVPLDYTGWVARFLEDGSPDPSFGEGGASHVFAPGMEHQLFDVHQTAEGHIMLGGNYLHEMGSAYLLMRMLSNGTIDTTFGDEGYSTPEVMINGSFGRALWMPASANMPVLIAGFTGDAFSILRASPDGVLDPSFGQQGIAITYVDQGFGQLNAMGRQSDGKLVVAGMRYDNIELHQRVALLRYHMEETLYMDAHHAAPSDLRVYPNPSSGNFSVEMPEGIAVQAQQLYSSGGQLLWTGGPVTSTTTQLEVAHLPAGLYHLLVIDQQGGKHSQRLVKL